MKIKNLFNKKNKDSPNDISREEFHKWLGALKLKKNIKASDVDYGQITVNALRRGTTENKENDKTDYGKATVEALRRATSE